MPQPKGQNWGLGARYSRSRAPGGPFRDSGKSNPQTEGGHDAAGGFETPGPGSWFIRALCYDNLKQPKPALEAYQKFLELDENANPDQVWQAQERSKVLRRMLEGKK